ncbi:MAG: T9SS type A sorting domain-containing protein [Saprospiraceae bacterium]|nr:T9SS type A sorting domain-containing protein [Saprospiraceae bacterium]
MKKIGLLLLCTGLVAGFMFFQNQKKNHTSAGHLPGGGNEENKEERRAWERRRYADPATGDIPEGIVLKERWFANGLPKAVSSRSGGLWSSRGPWNYGGRTRALAIDATNENRLLAGGVSGGVWLSEDGGQSWSRRTPLNAHPGCVSIAQDTRAGKTDTWYYLSGEFYGTSAGADGAFYVGDGLFKSTDGGQSWSEVSSTTGGNPQGFNSFFQTGWRVVTSPTDTADVVYLATVGAIYRSANGGNTWTAVRGGSTSNYSYFTDLAVTSTGVLYAALSSEGPNKGIWRSTNGLNWTNVTPANFPLSYNRIVIGINPNDENEVFFLGETPGYGLYTKYLSSDDWTSLWKYKYLGGDGAGANGQWEDRSLNLPSTGTEFDRFACQGGYDLVVRVQPGTNHVFAGGTSLWRSTDGFTSPNNTTLIAGYKPGTTLPFFELYPNHHPDQHDALFLPSDPNVMLTASDGGLHRTNDCNAPTVVWNSLNNGYQTTQLYTAIIDHNTPGDNTIIGGLQDNGNLFVNSPDPKKSWVQTVNGDGSYGGIAKNKAYYVLSINSGRVAKCTIDPDGTVTAFRRIDPIGPGRTDYQFINPLALDPNDDNILYQPARRRLYRQNDLGAIQLTGAWDSIAQGWTQFPDSTTGAITTISVSRANPAHRVYLGTENRRVYRIDNANTGSPSMVLCAQPTVGTTASVSSIAIDPDNADRVLISYSNYNTYSIWLSENAGQNWIRVAGNLEEVVGGSGSGPSVRSLQMLRFPNGSTKYFCATSVGLFSADTLLLHTASQPGTQWVLEAPDLIGSSVVDYVDVRPSDGFVVAATHGTGLYSAIFSPVSGSPEPGAAPVVRVSPNPTATFVHFNLSHVPEGKVDLRLYDLQGRLVRQASWDGPSKRISLEELNNGVYLYVLEGKGWRSSGRVLKTQ